MVGQTDRGAGLASNRSLDGLVSAHERGLLEYSVRWLPLWVLPDQLTVLGVLGSALAATALIASYVTLNFLWLALFGLFLNWLGDSLDGTLARVRHVERPRYGFFVDHATDVMSQLLLVLGLGLSPLMRLDIALLALVGYLGLSTYTYIKLHVTRSMQLSYFGVGPTEVRLLIGTGLVVAAVVDLPSAVTPWGTFGLFDAVGLLLFAFALASGIAMFVRDTRQLALIDPIRRVVPAEVLMIPIDAACDRGVSSERPHAEPPDPLRTIE